jgi:hypothetical protein
LTLKNGLQVSPTSHSQVNEAKKLI